MATTPSTTDAMMSGDQLVSDLIEATTEANPIEVIETVIASLDSDQTAMVNRADSGYLWKFKYGTVEVFVQLTGLTEADTLTVWASVLKLPVKDEAGLLRKLLEMNWTSTLEARFATLNNEVIVVSMRSLSDISPSEISRSITIVATIADDHDEPLQAQFGS